MNATKNIRPNDAPSQPLADETGIDDGDSLFEEHEWLVPPERGNNDSDGPPEPGQIGPLQQALYYSVLARS